MKSKRTLARAVAAVEKANEAAVARDAAIAAAAADGWGHRELARQTGLSHTGIAKIVEREEAA